MVNISIGIEREQVLPGINHTICIKAKSSAVLIAGPILGPAFELFLPFILETAVNHG